jgi:6-phosphogluconolactonase
MSHQRCPKLTNMSTRQPRPTPTLHLSADAAAQALAVANWVADQLRGALAQRERASLIVSGGKTPVAMWEALRNMPLDWSRVNITLADERWVAPQHPDSNAGLVSRHLLQGAAAAARWVPLYNGQAEPAGQGPSEGDVQVTEQRLAQQLSWPADVVVLGMGADAHTASWFPGTPLPQDNRLCFAVPAPVAPNVPLPRLSLSPLALLRARSVAVQLQGQDKRAVLDQALRAPSADLAQAQAALDAMPISRALWCSEASPQVFFAA